MSNDIIEGPNSQLPAHLQGIDTGVNTNLMAGVSQGGDRIGLKGSRFRLVVNGVEEGVFEENYLDAIILGAAPAISRVYYEGEYQPDKNMAPTCYSADGITPADDVHNKQSDKCATCPMNVKGSKVTNGRSIKACSYFRRVVVMLAGDTEKRHVYKLDVKSQGLFGDASSDGKNVNLIDYIKKFNNRGIDMGVVVTRVSFDTDSSVPKLLFRASRYVDEDEMNAVQDLVGSDEVNGLSDVTMSTVDLSNEEPTGGDDEDEDTQAETVEPAKAQKPAKATPQKPKAQKTAKAAPQKPAKAQKPSPKKAAPEIVDDEPMPTKNESVQEVDDSELDDILAGLE